jgi:hypothetical protein
MLSVFAFSPARTIKGHNYCHPSAQREALPLLLLLLFCLSSGRDLLFVVALAFGPRPAHNRVILTLSLSKGQRSRRTPMREEEAAKAKARSAERFPV